jgi:hypothetical protein
MAAGTLTGHGFTEATMSFPTDIPPHRSAEPPPRGHAAPDDPRPNAALLKADIDSGRTGDKNEVIDPGMAMLGTCEEAAGTPLTPEQLKTARIAETKERWRFGRPRDSAAHAKRDVGVRYGFYGFIVAVAAAVTASLVWLA